MAENTAEKKETTEELPQEVSKEEVTSATEVMLSVVKTSKAFRMYLANNPLLRRFLDDLIARLTSHTGKYGELKFDIDQFELKCKGKTVYESRDPKESLAFKMYSDGIRSFIFSEGIEGKEVTDFLEIIGKDRPSEVDDDIVTLLWMKDLPHITYILAEDYLEFDVKGQAGSGGDGSAQQEKIRGLYKDIPPEIEKLQTPMLMPQNIMSLTEEEIEWLKTARELDESRNALGEVVQVLFSILSVEKDFTVFGEFIDITVNLIGNLLHSGDIVYAVTLISFLKELSHDEKLSPDHKERLIKALEGTISGDIIKDLEGIVDTTDKIKPENLKDLILLFGKAAIRKICDLLGIVQKMEMRKVIIDALVEIGKDCPETFYPFLGDNRWYLVRNSLHILRRIGDPGSLQPVSKLVYHKEPRIRKEVLLYLEGSSDPKAMTYILKFLQDDVTALRIYAVKVLARSGFKGAVKPVLDIAASKEFEDRDISEKIAIFEALGELGSDELIPMFEEMIMKRYWFNKAKEKENVMLAASALRRVKTDAAVKVLGDACKLKKDEIKTIITQALRGITAEKAKVTTK
jgi:hypothetical protein